MIPQVGKIYSQDALVYGANLYQGIPADSLVFYLPLSEFTGAAETGQTLNLSGTPEFLVEDGIPCMKISDKNSYINMLDQSTLPMGSSPRTVSIWAKKTESGTFYMMGYGKGATAQAFLCLMSESSMNFDGVNGGTSQDVQITDEWHNYVYVYSGSAITMYLDGIKLGNDTAISLNTATGYPLGAVFGNTPERNYTQLISGYVAACRIYSRVLDAAEIAALASEFTPTQVNT